MTDPPDDFGAYLAAVQERDIDLLLMEEFHVSPAFASWFARELAIADADFDGAWHSVTDADGETDLLLRVVSPTGRTGILIENKIAAPQQHRQAERYGLRAARAQQAGKFDTVVTCLCSPAAYLAGLPEGGGYDGQIAYETIADWYAKDATGVRERWREQVMREAIRQGRRGYTMIVNETVTRFHHDFWEHLQHNEPALAMRRPTPKGSGSSWIRFKGTSFGSGREFALKLDQQIIELSFLGRQAQDLRALGLSWPAGAVISQKGKTAAVHLATPALDKTRSLAGQRDALSSVMAAVHALLPFASALD